MGQGQSVCIKESRNSIHLNWLALGKILAFPQSLTSILRSEEDPTDHCGKYWKHAVGSTSAHSMSPLDILSFIIINHPIKPFTLKWPRRSEKHRPGLEEDLSKLLFFYIVWRLRHTPYPSPSWMTSWVYRICKKQTVVLVIAQIHKSVKYSSVPLPASFFKEPDSVLLLPAQNIHVERRV